MIKLFSEFSNILENLNLLKSNNEIKDFRISLRVNNEIEVNITNRAQSELQKLQGVDQVSSLASEIQLNEVKNINI